MRNGMYAMLAADNIRRNSRTYLPYIITCVITAAMVYIIRSLAMNPGLEGMSGGDTLQIILSLGSHITRIFAFIFLFYTNSFLMKRRRRELGLFNILGMEKRHIAKVLLLEALYTAVISLVTGLTAGVLLDKLLFLLLTRMMGENARLGFYISWESMLVTCVFMLAVFLLIFLNALRQIHLAKPIELLHGSDVGEREPKARWLMAFLGLLLIGAGYYISIVTTQPLQALALFFVAVICVIIGTYFLFVAGSIVLLKILKRNKAYYYKTRHFISVSGMIYRMKQNAVGLANICILSTMVLVMISTTSCLMAGKEDIINTRYPYEIMLRSRDDTMPDKVEQYLSDIGADVGRSVKYTSLVFETIREKNLFYIPEDVSLDMDGLCETGIIDLADYNRLTGRSVELSEDSVLLFSKDKMSFDEIELLGKRYSVSEFLADFPISSTSVVKSVSIVVRDRSIMEELYEAQLLSYGDDASSIWHYYHFDPGSDDKEELCGALRNFLGGNLSNYGLDTRYGAEESFMSLYGGLFFLGVFLGILFLMQTVLIIYYKQISEGYDDKKRFEIMQNVGMSRAEVRQSIHSQIITVFFLPLVTAGIHTGFSFPLICRLLVMFNMTNTALFAVCILICFAVFAAIYALIYSLTAGAYYKIVSK